MYSLLCGFSWQFSSSIPFSQCSVSSGLITPFQVSSQLQAQQPQPGNQPWPVVGSQSSTNSGSVQPVQPSSASESDLSYDDSHLWVWFSKELLQLKTQVCTWFELFPLIWLHVLDQGLPVTAPVMGAADWQEHQAPDGRRYAWIPSFWFPCCCSCTALLLPQINQVYLTC